jgi:hypothetical protein
MQRRFFLKAVAKAVPAAGIQTFRVNQARAQTSALPPRASRMSLELGRTVSVIPTR